MRLSAPAMMLLLLNDVDELQKLPFEDLIHPEDLAEYNKQCADPLSAVSPSQSLPNGMQGILDLASINKAVVVSSGFIDSRHAMRELEKFTVKNNQPFLCPRTREQLKQACYGQELKSYVRLPLVDKAIQTFRQLRDTARAATAPLQPTAMDLILDNLSSNPIQVECNLLVTRKIFIIEIKNSGQHLKPFFTAALPNPKSKINSNQYRVDGYGRCWEVPTDEEVGDDACPAILEFWMNDHYGQSTEDLLDLFEAFLAPLNLPQNTTMDETVLNSTADLGHNGEANLLPEPLNLSVRDAARCCLSFLTKSQQIAAKKNKPLIDEAKAQHGMVHQSYKMGLMQFAPPSAGASTTATYTQFTATQGF